MNKTLYVNFESNAKEIYFYTVFKYIRQTSGSFNGIWSDKGTEKNIIKYSKGSGGIVGITNQKSSLVIETAGCLSNGKLALFKS
jgi:hypothetical protein